MVREFKFGLLFWKNVFNLVSKSDALMEVLVTLKFLSEERVPLHDMCASNKFTLTRLE